MKKRLAAWALCITMILTSAAPLSAAAAQPQQAAPSVADTLPQELTPAPLTADEPAEQNTPEDDTVPASGEPTPGNDTTPGDSEPTSGDDTTPGDSETTPGDDATPDSGEPAPGDSTTPDDGEPAPADDATPDDGEPTPGDDATPDDGEPVSGAAGGTAANALPDADSAPAQQPGSERYTITPGINSFGFAGVTVELLQGIRVDPARDAQGNPIQVRVADITSTDPDYTWDGQNTLTPGEGNVVYTITYEAYVQPEQGEEIVYAKLTFSYTVRGAGDIGGKLDGDRAYISEAGLLPDATTASGVAMRTGSAPWDEEEGPGNDQDDLDNTVRTFDIVSYTAYFKSKVRKDAPYSFYETGTLHFEFVLPGTGEEARFETESMSWLSAKKEVRYKITESTYNGEPCQVLRGSYLWEPSDENPAAIGESYQELTLVIRVLAMKNGTRLTPRFTFWLDHNDVPEKGLVTGSGHTCTEHDEPEYKTITGPEVRVTAAPRYNVEVKTGAETLQYKGTFNFSESGNDLAQNKDAGTVEGRVVPFGVTIQIQGKSAQDGLRGCEFPRGPIKLDLVLSSEYLGSNGETHDTTQSYQPLLWSMEGNSKAAEQQDGRSVAFSGKNVENWAKAAAPFNQVTEGYIGASCNNGGTWQGTQDGNVIHVTVTDYEIDLGQLPYTFYADSTPNQPLVYYDPDAISGYWDVQNACFSAGEFWIVQPFYDAENRYIVDVYGAGSFTTTIKDVNLQMTSESGQALATVQDNSNQVTRDDDRASAGFYIDRTGTIDQNVIYLKYDYSNWDDALTEGQLVTGKDWLLAGNPLTIETFLLHDNADGQNIGVAYDSLVKFDDAFFVLESVETYDYTTILYGARPGKTGWNHSGKEPNDPGYDTEMINATADDLIFFSSLDELRREGYTCVAVLAERRQVSTQGMNHFHLYLKGHSRTDAQPGGVYMVTHNAIAWNKADVQQDAVDYLDKSPEELTDEDYNEYVKSAAFPSRKDVTDAPMSYQEDYPSAFWKRDASNDEGIRNYKKAQYNENGYVGGTTEGRRHGDSCLVVGYSTEITKSTAQTIGSGAAKKAYDLDVGQRIADYVLHPSAVRAQGESSTGGELVTTVYVEDTLPKGLTYIPNSSYWGGTYTQTDEGKQGTVAGGQQIKPDITVHSDGTTTLRWTLENVTISSAAYTDIGPIYYSCDIGRAGDEENDVKPNASLLNTAKIWSDNETKRDFAAYNNNLADFSILVSKNNAVSLSKLAKQTVVDQGDPMSFTLNVGNNATNSMAVIAMDSLPYVGDAAGSAFTGDCVVTEYTITALQGEFASNFKLYYTTSEGERGKGSADYKVADFTRTDSVWQELTVDSMTGEVELPQGAFEPVAIAAVGTLPAQKTLKMDITMLLPEAKPGEYVANRLTRGDLESFGRSYIVSRTLEGVVWLDDDQNGLRAADETRIDGVQATLMQLTEGGNPANPADYTPYQISDGSDGSGGYKSATVATGYQLDLSTGEQITLGAGRYKFTNLPQGTFGVRFTNGTFQLDAYTASPQNVGSDDTLDSDAAPTYADDGTLTQAFIAGIEMPALEQITTMVYASRDHDLGLYPTTYRLTVSKTVTGALGDRDKLFEFKLTLNDAAGKPITGSFSYTGASTVDGVAAPADGTLNVTAGAAAFRLKHGQSITIAGLPPQCGYTVTEPNAETDGYDVSITVNDEAAESAEGTLTADAAVAFTNSRVPATPTGILLDSAPMLALVGLSLAGGALLLAGRRRRRTCPERR